MDRNALAELLQALESRRDAEERRREERYTALIERDHDISEFIRSTRQNRRATADQLTANFNLEREQPVSSKTVRQELAPHYY
ncbi:UNVERIFIED_CONTAM: hypothetical protein FKN15_038272 [Acipenser sinensis]